MRHSNLVSNSRTHCRNERQGSSTARARERERTSPSPSRGREGTSRNGQISRQLLSPPSPFVESLDVVVRELPREFIIEEESRRHIHEPIGQKRDDGSVHVIKQFAIARAQLGRRDSRPNLLSSSERCNRGPSARSAKGCCTGLVSLRVKGLR